MDDTSVLLSGLLIAPPIDNLTIAIRNLFNMGAVTDPKLIDCQLTFFGAIAGQFPVGLQLAKLIVMAAYEGMACEGVILAASGAVQVTLRLVMHILYQKNYLLILFSIFGRMFFCSHRKRL